MRLSLPVCGTVFAGSRQMLRKRSEWAKIDALEHECLKGEASDPFLNLKAEVEAGQDVKD